MEKVTKIALESSDVLLDIDSCINVTDYKVDPFMVDHFWQRLVSNHSITIDRAIYVWLGYDCDNEYSKNGTFKLLKSHTINYREVACRDVDFNQFPEFVK